MFNLKLIQQDGQMICSDGVKTRIETVDPSYPYPEAAIDTNGSLCKGFSVTNNADDFP